MPILRQFLPFRPLRKLLVARQRKKIQEARWLYTQAILTTVGNITITWAGIELMITHLIIWHHAQTGQLGRVDLPRMLAPQLEYIKKKLEKDDLFDEITTEYIREIRLEISRLNKFRNNLIHGILHQRDRSSLLWHTHAVKIQGNRWEVFNITYSHAELQDLARDISNLSHRMSPFIARIVGIPHPENF